MHTNWTHLDTRIPEWMAQWKIPAVAAAIVQHGEVVYAAGFGCHQIGAPGAVDADTLFAIGSNTKAFTATAVGLLVQEGKLAWDDRVTKYLPAFQLHDSAATRLMTVRDLLCHRSGLISYAGDFMAYGTVYSSDEVLQRVRYVEPAYPFRGGYGYSNIMFLAAGKVVEAVSEQTWDVFVRERLLAPLGMNRTLTGLRDLPGVDNVAQPHQFTRGQIVKLPFADLEAIAPAGSILSSAADMTRWLRFQLAGGRVDGERLVDAAVLEEARTSHTIVPILPEFKALIPRRHFSNYGLGWVLNDYAGRLLVNHSGGVDGMLSQTAFLPEEELGLVVLTNLSPNRLYPALMYTIIDQALGLPEYDWGAAMLAQDRREQARAAEERQKLDTSRLKDSRPSLALEGYTGVYTNPVYGEMGVRLDQGKLALHPAGNPHLTGPLEHWHADTFLCTWSNPSYEESFVHFQVGMDGKAERLRLKVGDFIDLQPYEFVRKG